MSATLSRDAALWPADQDVIRFVPKTRPNARGCRNFMVLSWCDGKRHALWLFGDLDKHVERARREGTTVEVFEAEVDCLEAA